MKRFHVHARVDDLQKSIDFYSRLFAAEPDAGDEARRHQPPHRRCECTGDGEDAEQQQIKLVDRLAAPAIAELALAWDG